MDKQDIAEVAYKNGVKRFAEMFMRRLNDELLDYRNDLFTDIQKLADEICKELTEGK